MSTTYSNTQTPRTSTKALLHFKSYIDELYNALECISDSELQNFVNLVKNVQANGKTIFIIGNGGSASTASHWATDLSKGLHHAGAKGIKAISLTDNSAWISATANDLGYHQVFTDQLRVHASSGDLLIAISASGWSENILHALQHAKRNDIHTLSVVGFDGGAAKEISDHCLHIPTEKGRYGTAEDAQSVLNHFLCDFLVQESK